jgi:hypothetical protein
MSSRRLNRQIGNADASRVFDVFREGNPDWFLTFGNDERQN